MSNPLLVGIDVHRNSNTVSMTDSSGRSVAPRFSVANNRPGAEKLAQTLHAVAEEQGYDAIQVAAEATGWYWFHLFQTLDQHPLLGQHDLSLFPFNPRLTANFRKTYAQRNKTDLADATLIADRLRFGRDLPRAYVFDEPYLALRLLTRHRAHLVHQIAREKAYFLAHLYLKASEYTRLKPFSDTFGAASRALLEGYNSMEEIAALPLDALAEQIDQLGKGSFADPASNARTLLVVARDSYALPEGLQAAVNLLLKQSLQQIASLERMVRRCEASIAEALVPLPNTLDTVPGVGPAFAAGMVAEIGDLARFDGDQAKVANYAGLVWRKHQSGAFQADETPLSHSGNRYLRYYLCEAANSVRMRDAEYRAYYERKCAEVRQHKHKRASVLTARKLVRLVVRLLTTNQPYRPRRT